MVNLDRNIGKKMYIWCFPVAVVTGFGKPKSATEIIVKYRLTRWHTVVGLIVGIGYNLNIGFIQKAWERHRQFSDYKCEEARKACINN